MKQLIKNINSQIEHMERAIDRHDELNAKTKIVVENQKQIDCLDARRDRYITTCYVIDALHLYIEHLEDTYLEEGADRVT